MGFSLRIINAPVGAVLWNANFWYESFDYDPIADSGWLNIAGVWVYPGDPLGCTSLHIWIIDADNNVLLSVFDYGPVNNDKSYVFDCSTLELTEEVPSGVITVFTIVDYSKVGG